MSSVVPAVPRGFVRLAWASLGWNLLVIAWGAYVRASGSGAGCGDHWPLCNGEVVPRAPALETLVELAHRLTSGLALLLVVGVYVWVRRFAARGTALRRCAFWSVVFMFIEAAVGAGLVLFEYVAQNASMARAAWLGAHLANTLVLLAWIGLTAWYAGGRPGPVTLRRPRTALIGGVLLGLVVVGMTGAIAALGDTLFPAGSLAEGLRQDFSPTAHLLLRLRVLHPTLAVTIGIGAALVGFWASVRASSPMTQHLGRTASALVLFQWGVGTTNLLLLAPIWLQLVHLLVADLVWLAFVFLGAALLAEAVEPRTAAAPHATPATAGGH